MVPDLRIFVPPLPTKTTRRVPSVRVQLQESSLELDRSRPQSSRIQQLPGFFLQFFFL